MGPTWVLSAPGGTHVSPINLAIRDTIWGEPYFEDPSECGAVAVFSAGPVSGDGVSVVLHAVFEPGHEELHFERTAANLQTEYTPVKYPGYFWESHWKSMGFPKISRVKLSGSIQNTAYMICTRVCSALFLFLGVIHWRGNVVMMTKFPVLAPEVFWRLTVLLVTKSFSVS